MSRDDFLQEAARSGIDDEQKQRTAKQLLSFSKQKIAAAGHDTVVIMALTNTDDLASVELVHEGDVKAGEVVVKFSA